MDDFLSEAARGVVSLTGPTPDETQRDMADHAEAGSFPIIGAAAGGLLTALARLKGAERVFEFGSGFGYSASWFARGMARGEVVLTEHDADELDRAREFLATASYAPDFRYEHGDALDVVAGYDGPFDLVLVDHEKRRYVEGFERIRDKVVPGGAIVADNMLRASYEPTDVLAGHEGDGVQNESAAGVAAYLERLRADPAFVTTLLPVDNGVAVSVRSR